jgi:hypothetical protein
MRKKLVPILLAAALSVQTSATQSPAANDASFSPGEAALNRYSNCVSNGGDHKFCCEFNGGTYSETGGGTRKICAIAGRTITSSGKVLPKAAPKGLAPK